MLVFEAKLKGKPGQYRSLDGAIRTGQFIRNSCLRYWMDRRGIGKTEMFRYNTQLRNNPEFPWAKAAINILSRVGHTRIHASGENHLCELGESLADKWTR